MAAAVCHYLRAAFVSRLDCYFLTSASRETSISETGRTCLHEAANTNTDPPECIRYPTTTLQLAEQTVTHTWEPWADHIVYRTQHQHLEPGEDYVNLWLYLPPTSCSRKKKKKKKKGWSYFPFFLCVEEGGAFILKLKNTQCLKRTGLNSLSNLPASYLQHRH